MLLGCIKHADHDRDLSLRLGRSAPPSLAGCASDHMVPQSPQTMRPRFLRLLSYTPADHDH